jgi:DMSO/TMAO reductase YedYZ molybdopterin-dependent catalytic subunit
MSPATRGFRHFRRPSGAEASRVPPGQYIANGFPVLSAGPTPSVRRQDWTFTITEAGQAAKSWTWPELRALPSETITADVHCVTHWTKLGTEWQGVSVDTLLGAVDTDARYVLAFCDGGYTTNLAVDDVTGGKAWVAFAFAGAPLAPEHGGPARLLVPHLYFWKSAKWVRGLELRAHDEPGFWEAHGYHMHGDPWKEQRYTGE